MKKLITIFVLCYGFLLSAQNSENNSPRRSQNGEQLFNTPTGQPESRSVPIKSNLGVQNRNCTVSGVAISTTGTVPNYPTYSPPTTPVTCTPSAAFATGDSPWTGGGTTGVVVYNFSQPVSSVRVSYSAVNGVVDIGTISVNSSGVMTLSNPCGINVAGNVVTCNFGAAEYGDIGVTVSSTVPFTSITLVNTGGSSGFVGGEPCNFIIYNNCLAGTASPAFRSTFLTNRCPATSVNLNSLLPGNQPAGTQLTWHTGTPATLANMVSNPSAVGGGTYYAAFYDPNGNCFSPTTAINVSISRCISDLKIDKAVNVGSATAGTNVIFTITAANGGSSPATGVTVTDVLPSGYVLVSATPTVGTWTAPYWNVGNLAVGASATITIVATVQFSGNYSNTATIAGNQADPDFSNNTSTATIRVLIPFERIDAVDDDFRRLRINNCAGGTTPSVFSNDNINGASFLPSAVTVSLVAPLSIPGATIDANGVITIPPGTAPGSYTLNYNVCIVGGFSCDTAAVFLNIGSITIAAFNDDFQPFPISSSVGGQTPSVLTNDTYYPGVTVSLASSPIPGATIDQAGIITIPGGVAPGSYTFLYQLTDCRGNVVYAKADVLISRRVIIIDPDFPFDPIALKQVTIYPNPSNGQFTIDATGFEAKDVSVSIFNQMGRNVFENSSLKNQEKVDLSNLPKGIYFVTLTSGAESVQRKLVIE